MTVGLSDRLRKVRRAALVATGVAVAMFQISGSLGLRINTSPSLPMGLYITTADAERESGRVLSCGTVRNALHRARLS